VQTTLFWIGFFVAAAAARHAATERLPQRMPLPYAREDAVMKAVAITFACVLGLAGCNSEAEETAGQNQRLAENGQTAERIAQADDMQCRSSGLEIGTAAYADCRLRLKSLHLQAVASQSR
jgi:hypothetical protein